MLHIVVGEKSLEMRQVRRRSEERRSALRQALATCGLIAEALDLRIAAASGCFEPCDRESMLPRLYLITRWRRWKAPALSLTSAHVDLEHVRQEYVLRKEKLFRQHTVAVISTPTWRGEPRSWGSRCMRPSCLALR